MSATLRIIIIIVIALLLAVAGYFSYTYYMTLKGPSSPAIEAISEDVAFFIQTDDIRSSLYNLTKETEYWPLLAEGQLLENFTHQFHYFDSIISSYNSLNEILEFNTFSLVCDKNPEGDFGFLFLLELPQGSISQEISSFIENENGLQSLIMSKEFEKATIQIVNLSGLEQLFYYTVYKGLFIASFDGFLVEKTILVLNQKRNFLNDPYFTKVYNTAGKNVDGNLYINFNNFSQCFTKAVSEDYLEVSKEFGNLAYWMETDLMINSDDILLNGYSILHNDSNSILERFQQTPQLIKIPEILPYNIAWMLHFGLSDMQKFVSTNNRQELYNSALKNYKQKYGIDIESEFVSWLGDEIAVVSTEQQMEDNRSMIVVHTNDLVKAAISLGSMSMKVNIRNNHNDFKMNYNDYSIHQINLPNLFKDIISESFPILKKCYYVSIKDYFIFAENIEDLTFLIDQFYQQKTMTKNFNYQSFSDNISDRSNIFFYCNIKKNSQPISELFKNLPQYGIPDFLQSFEGAAVQFSYINQMFYTNLYCKYNPNYQDLNPTTWETKLESMVSGKPFLVRNHRNGKMNVLCFDESNKMYLIDHVGRIQWQLPLIEKPLGEINVIDYFKNGKFQYLFNTENYVYLIDLNGNYVANYPIKLITPSTNPLAVFDYENNEEYRILLALVDNKIYNFDREIIGIEGWSKIQASGKVLHQVQHLVKGNKDYIFVSDDNGKVNITNRKGEMRIKPRKKINRAPNSVFYPNLTNSKGDFITTDTKGNLVYLSSNGSVSKTSFGEFSPEHYFFYEDFDGDDSYDFIFIDNNNLTVFDRFKKVSLNQQFPEPVSKPPVLFQWGNKAYIGIVLEAANEIWILDHSGRRFENQVILGSTTFTVGNLNNDNKLNLITGEGDKIKNFQLN